MRSFAKETKKEGNQEFSFLKKKSFPGFIPGFLASLATFSERGRA